MCDVGSVISPITDVFDGGGDSGGVSDLPNIDIVSGWLGDEKSWLTGEGGVGDMFTGGGGDSYADAAEKTAAAQIEATRIASEAQKESARLGTEALTKASEASIASQEKMYEQARSDIAPWRKRGEKALRQLAGKVSAGPGDFQKSAGYDFRLQEGLKAVQGTTAPRSGAQMKALTRYGQDYASAEQDKFLGRYYESLRPLQSLAGVGQTAAGGQAAGAMQTGQGIANTQMATGQGIAGMQQGLGQGLAQSALSAGNARASGYMNAYNMQQQEQANKQNMAIGVGGAAASFFSSKEYKEFISLADTGTILDQFKESPVYNWKYIDDDTQHIGHLTGDAPKIMVTEDGKMIKIPDYLGVLSAVTQALIGRVEELEVNHG